MQTTMNQKKSNRFTPLLMALCIIIGIIIGTFYANHFSGNRLNIINSGSNRLSNLLHIISDQYVDEVNIDSLVDVAIPQILSELDPHSVYINAKQAQTATDDLNDLGLRLCRNLFGNFARGLGCCLEQDLELEQFTGAECVERLGYQCVIDAALADLKKRLERICLRAKRGSLFACHIISSSFFARSLNALPLWLMLSFSSAVS